MAPQIINFFVFDDVIIKNAYISKMSFDIRSICTKFEVGTITLSEVIKVLSCLFYKGVLPGSSQHFEHN